MNVIRRNAKRGGLVAAALVLIVLIALFVKAYQDASPASPNAAGPGGSGTPSAGAGSASASAHPSGARTLLGLPATLPPYTLHPGEPGGFVFADIPKHTLVLTVTSAGP